MANIVLADGNDGTNITYPSTSDTGDFEITANAGYYFASLPIVTATSYTGDLNGVCTLNETATICTVTITWYTPLIEITIDGIDVLPTTQPIPTQVGMFIPYVVTPTIMQQISQLVFADTSTDIGDYILSLRQYDFPLEKTKDVEIRLGNNRTQIKAPISLQSEYTINFGNITIPNTNNNINDYDNREINIMLPYLGLFALDNKKYTGKTITLTYSIDIINGLGVAKISIVTNNSTIDTDFFSGKIGKDLPYKTSQINGLQGLIDVEQNGLYPLEPYILILYHTNVDTIFDKYLQQTVNYYDKLSNLHGLHNVILTDVQFATQTIQDELIMLMSTGVIFP